ncbi:calcium release-activated calcium channel protein 1 [Folsomia candida]|nr:calcium release-activated calcium channel protein 1 [Folsomia candida]
MALSLPPVSPPPSPPEGCRLGGGSSIRGPRSVSWSLPSPHSARTSISLPAIRIEHVDQYHHSHQSSERLADEDPNSPEFLDWRRLHLSRAKLSGITEMAALMAGFSVVATVELQINEDAHPYMLTAFTVTTALLVCTTMLAIMISTCILPHVTVVAKMHPHSKPHESPHDAMMWYIDLSWVLANSTSIFLFTLDVILLCWVKFTHFSEAASIAATVIMIPVLVATCIFGILFYRNIVKHQFLLSESKVEELEEFKRQIDQVSSLVGRNNVIQV